MILHILIIVKRFTVIAFFIYSDIFLKILLTFFISGVIIFPSEMYIHFYAIVEDKAMTYAENSSRIVRMFSARIFCRAF